MDDTALTNTLSIIDLVLTAFGFGFTIWQLARTARASEASVKAIERTERRMALNHLLVVLPQFQIIENDLDHAIQVDDRGLAVRALVNCKNVASEVAADQDSVDQEIVERCQIGIPDHSTATRQQNSIASSRTFEPFEGRTSLT